MRYQYKRDYKKGENVEPINNSKKVFELIEKFNAQHKDTQINQTVTRMLLQQIEENDNKTLKGFFAAPIDNIQQFYKSKAEVYKAIFYFRNNFDPKKINDFDKLVGDMDGLASTITDLLYDEEIEENEKQIKDDEKATANNAKNNYEKSILNYKTACFNKIGLSNTNNHIENVKKSLEYGESLSNKLYNNLKAHLDNRDNFSISSIETKQQQVDDYLALKENLKRKNPIARFFSFGTKSLLSRFENRIKNDLSLKNDEGFQDYIYSNASLSEKNIKYLNSANLLKDKLINFTNELDKITKDLDRTEEKVNSKVNNMIFKSDVNLATQINKANAKINIKNKNNDLEVYDIMSSKNSKEMKEKVNKTFEQYNSKIADSLGKKPEEIKKDKELFELPSDVFDAEYDKEYGGKPNEEQDLALNNGTIEKLNS